MKRLVLVGATALLLAFGLASCGRPTPEKISLWMTKKLTSELKLTEPQKAGLEAIRTEALATFKKGAEKRKTVNAEVDSQLRSGKIDAEAVKKLMAGVHESMEKEHSGLVDRIATWVQTLSPEQRVKLADLHKKMSDHMGPH